MEQGAGGEQPRGVSANKAYPRQGRGPCKSMPKEGGILSRLTKYSGSRKYVNCLRNSVYTARVFETSFAFSTNIFVYLSEKQEEGIACITIIDFISKYHYEFVLR